MNIENDSLVGDPRIFLNKIQAQNAESKSCLMPNFNIRGSNKFT